MKTEFYAILKIEILCQENVYFLNNKRSNLIIVTHSKTTYSYSKHTTIDKKYSNIITVFNLCTVKL